MKINRAIEKKYRSGEQGSSEIDEVINPSSHLRK